MIHVPILMWSTSMSTSGNVSDKRCLETTLRTVNDVAVSGCVGGLLVF